MRPLYKTPPRVALSPANLEDQLLDAVGSFCGLCERPLPEIAHAWDARRVATVQSATVEDWPGLLPICRNCNASAAAAPPRATSAGMALPHRDRTFGLDTPSPFTYVLERVTVELVNPDGTLAEPPEVVEKALVKATTPEAQATIDHFALNTPYYDAALKTFRIPIFVKLTREDRRVELRTEAWHSAVSFCTSLRDHLQDPLIRHAALTQMSIGVQAHGFWSVWATVLWQTLPDPSTLRAVLLPHVSATLGASLAGVAPTHGAGAFQGTRPDALFQYPEGGR